MDERQGWTSSPNSRGTIDIIWSCALTLFLCCWSVLVPNVPDPGASSVQVLSRKLFLLGLCAIAPEIIFQVALGQWLSAHRSIKPFHVAGYTDWTIAHGFYADMGGLHLVTEDVKPFPINAAQLHYLVTQRGIPYPKILEVHIRDKNKSDGMLRLITLVQTLWFLVNVVARRVQQLPITALELSTSAFVLLSFATTLCWFQKPADILHPDFITVDQPVEILLPSNASYYGKEYLYTPLDCVGRQEWTWSRLWSHGLYCLRSLNLAAPPAGRPVARFQNTIAPSIDGFAYVLFFWVSLAYLAIFITGWNFSFPTDIERMLWRIASLTALVSALVVFVTMHVFSSTLYTNLRRQLGAVISRSEEREATSNQSNIDRGRAQPTFIATILARLRNNSKAAHPALTVSAGAVLITWVLGVGYSLSRAYIFVADIIELRSLPSVAYQTVDWTSNWPHF